ENECVQEGINLAALGTLKSIFIESKIPKNNSEHPIKKFSVFEGDHLTYLNIFTIFKETSNKEGFCGKYMLNLKSLEHGMKIAKQLMFIFLSLNLESKPSNAR
ncbi:MAG: ATP-dependent RNA helicase, partial [Paramarteilia canceri]